MNSRDFTFLGFALIAAAIGTWTVIAAVRPGSLTLGRALGVLTSRRGGRLITLLAWGWLGWHLFVRGNGAFKK